ncbi:NYN domain-containing protein [Mycena floridula]|nr:NYN domain-containing protein [Mycena floridula]
MPSEPVAVFWDYESCQHVASGCEIVNAIRTVVHRYGHIAQFKAYLDISEHNAPHLRFELQSSGVSLTDCPLNGLRNISAQMIIVDMFTYALEKSPPCTLVLITGDRDFAYAVSVLRLRGYNVVLISSQSPAWKSQASACFDWNTEVVEKSLVKLAGTPPIVYTKSTAASRTSSTHSRVETTYESLPNRDGLNFHSTSRLTAAAPSFTPFSPFDDPHQSDVLGATAYTDTTAGPSKPAVYMSKVIKRPDFKLENVLLSRSLTYRTLTMPEPASPDRTVAGSEPSSAQQKSLSLYSSPTEHSNMFSKPFAEPSDIQLTPPTTASLIPPEFLYLAQQLEARRLSGDPRPLRSKFAAELPMTVYRRAGVEKFKDYAALAEKAGIIALGGAGGYAWITLHTQWHGKVPS